MREKPNHKKSVYIGGLVVLIPLAVILAVLFAISALAKIPVFMGLFGAAIGFCTFGIICCARGMGKWEDYEIAQQVMAHRQAEAQREQEAKAAAEARAKAAAEAREKAAAEARAKAEAEKVSTLTPEPAAEKEDKQEINKGVEPPPEGCVQSHHKIAGVTQYESVFLSIAEKNPDFDMSKRDLVECDIDEVYRYTFPAVTAALEPEPDNPYDPKAIKVLADGQLIGYIKKGSTAHIHKLLQEDRIARLQLVLGGGPKKKVWYNGDDYADEPRLSDYNVERTSINFWAGLYIDEKQ